jgi:trk system potassium uptake protein
MRIAFWLGFLGVSALIYDIGFEQPQSVQESLKWIYRLALSGGVIFIIAFYFFKKNKIRKKVWLVDAFLIIFYLVMLFGLLGWINTESLQMKLWTYIALIIVFIRELSSLRIEFNNKYLNPAQLFITSFVAIILAGTLLLMLPNSTYKGISLLDSLFTSTSAVCVTGLTVVDIGSYFTPFGLIIIMILIQAGGIGIMTFTSYFGYFFRGGASYQNRLMMQDMTNSERIAEVFSTLKKIILITFLIECLGALIIYFSLDKTIIPSAGNRIFFSLFHSVSGFCNAGFSTLPNNLYEAGFRFNYALHLTIAVMFIIGGLGFPIVFNSFNYLKQVFRNFIYRKKPNHSPWIIDINTRIVLITTLVLLVVGTSLFYFFEYNNTLAEHKGLGKFVTAFFSAATPRTAGFNTINTSALHFSTIMIVFVLMWIGASPGSTGGGVKTSTFAIAILNFLSIARGKDRVEIFRREISPMSTRRAFAILTLSVIVIGLSVFFLAIFENEKDLRSLAFESFSAFGTVGLSLGITSQLSDPGKIVIILTMFIGRVSMLTILLAFMRKMVNLKYKYPTEEVLIN